MSGTWSSLLSRRQIDFRSEPVTDLRIGQKVFGRGGVIAELFPHLPNKSTEILQLMAVFRSPDCCQNARVRKRKSGVRHQKMEQFEFLGCDVNCRSRSLHHAPHEIKFYLANCDRGGIVSLGSVCAADGSAKPRRQFSKVERLSDVVVRARVKRLDLV